MVFGVQKAVELGYDETVDREYAIVSISFDQCKSQQLLCICTQTRVFIVSNRNSWKQFVYKTPKPLTDQSQDTIAYHL